jgi:aspartate-semialdehyde dehydrogenase
MHDESIAISATCVRAPIFVSHSVALHVEFSRPWSVDDVREILSQAPGVTLQDDPTVSLYPQPWAAAGLDDVFVGRIRQDTSHPNGMVFWVVSDNLRKGAATNAIQIAEELVTRKLI